MRAAYRSLDQVAGHPTADRAAVPGQARRPGPPAPPSLTAKGTNAIAVDEDGQSPYLPRPCPAKRESIVLGGTLPAGAFIPWALRSTNLHELDQLETYVVEAGPDQAFPPKRIVVRRRDQAHPSPSHFDTTRTPGGRPVLAVE